MTLGSLTSSAIAAGLIPALLLTTPLLVLLRHHGYSLVLPEVATSVLLFALPGLFAALLSRWRWVAGLIAMLAAAFFAQSQLPTFGAPAVVVLSIGGFWSAYSPVAQRVALLALVALFSSSLIVPVGTRFEDRTGPGVRGTAPSFLLHVVLDEHIGIEGMQAAAEHVGTLPDEARDFFRDRGFAIFEGAYSEYYQSNRSLAHVFNLSPGEFHPEYYERGTGGFEWRLTSNRLLESLRASGYAIRVFQSDYLDLCSNSSHIACHTYSITDLGVLQDSPLSTTERSWAIASAYLGTSGLYLWVRDAYDRIADKARALSIPVPLWTWERDRVGPLSAMAAAGRVETELRGARIGDAIIVHLLAPHFPYVLDAKCQIKPVRDWDNRSYVRRSVDANTAQTRGRRYSAYADQVRCLYSILARLLDAIPGSVRDQSIVMVHGDHGSRIVSTEPIARLQADLSKADLLDGYSTLFAIRSPRSGSTGNDERLAISCLVKASLDLGPFPRALDACRRPPQVLLTGRGDRFVSYPDASEVSRP